MKKLFILAIGALSFSACGNDVSEKAEVLNFAETVAPELAPAQAEVTTPPAEQPTTKDSSAIDTTHIIKKETLAASTDSLKKTIANKAEQVQKVVNKAAKEVTTEVKKEAEKAKQKAQEVKEKIKETVEKID